MLKMPITSAEVIEDRRQADGRRSVRYRFVGHDGQVEHQSLLVGPDFDAVADVSTRVSSVEDRFRQIEINSMADIVAAGNKSVPEIISEFQWMAVNDALREAIRWGVEGDDPRQLANMEGVFNYVESTFTDEQIISMAGVSQEKVDIYRTRIAKVLGTGRVKDELAVVESLRGEL